METKLQGVDKANNPCSRDEFLAEGDTDVMTIEVPSVKTPGKSLKVKIKAWTAEEREEILAACTKPGGKIDGLMWLAMTLQKGMVEPAFKSREDLAVLRQKAPALLDRVAKEIWKISGVDINAGADSAKNA